MNDDLDQFLAQTATCPECGHRDTLANFDVGGADEGNVFCNRCDSEVSIAACLEPRELFS
jgi:hypothetical protein